MESEGQKPLKEPTTRIFATIGVLDEYTGFLVNFKKSLELLIDRDTELTVEKLKEKLDKFINDYKKIKDEYSEDQINSDKIPLRKQLFAILDFNQKDISNLISNVGLGITKLEPKDRVKQELLNDALVYKLINSLNQKYLNLMEKIKGIDDTLFSKEGDGTLLAEYINERVKNLPELGKLNLSNYKKKIRNIHEQLRDLLPRTDRKHVGISLHKIEKVKIEKVKVKEGKKVGGKRKKFNENFLKECSRKELNIIGKKYGLKDVEKIKNKRILINYIDVVNIYKIGLIKRRKRLNSLASLLDINPKSYKKKSYLISKINQTIF